MEVKAICGEHLVLIQEAQAGFKVLVIVVFERLNDGGAAEAICAGAIACLDFQNAMRSLAFLVENVAARMLSNDHLNTKRVLLVSDQVTLTTPDYCLMDGQHDILLAPIPGALLECLASRPNELVLSTDLIRSAWGRAEDATTNALHQQIYQLRERLSEFGIAKNLESVRGRGYILRSSPGR
jgi:DNA-binding response OmpR family regulator